MGGRGGAGNSRSPIEKAIRSAYHTLLKESGRASGSHISLADIRDHLGGKFSAHDLSNEFKRLARGNGPADVDMTSISNQKAMTNRERAAGVPLGNDLVTGMAVGRGI